MNNAINSHAQAINESYQLMSFNFSEDNSTIRNVWDDGKIYFVANDVCKALGYVNARKALKDHCKGVTKRYILTDGGSQNMNFIPESDVFRLIIKSTLPRAEKFERWVMEEVLPAIRKQGYYGTRRSKSKADYIDARDTPHYFRKVNDCNVRCIDLEDEVWVSINDINRAIYANTGSNQTAKKLNAKRTLAIKVHIFGNTHPSWFTNELGLKLILAGSRKLRDANQLTLGI